MKKASKMLVLLLVAILTLSLFSGCAVFGKNTEAYRATTAITVGDEKITIGKLIDTYNNYYNNYYSYISQGYISADYVFEMAVNSLYTQFMKVDAYKKTAGVPTYTHSSSFNFNNQEYLTPDELSFAIRYIKYVLFSTLDGVVEGYASAEFELGEAKNDDKDTSRDFLEFDDLKGYATYSEYNFAENFENKEMKEYISKYYEGIINSDDISMDSYVYATEDAAKTKLDELNDRIEGDDKISFAQFKEWQERALSQYKKNVLRSYEYDLTALVTRQVEDYIVSLIVAKYNYQVYSVIDTTDLQATIAQLNTNCAQLTENQIAGFNVNNNFVNYIEGLTDSSYIYAVPDGYNYVFVKNILIPFTDSQKTILSNLQKQLGSKSDVRYLAKCTEFASQIIADDFFSEKDEDGKYGTVSNIFALDAQGNLIINPQGELGQYFAADGNVIAMEGKTKDETINELMKRFNTDTAQHSSLYEYVVRVGQTPENYTAKWVTEFVDATNDAVLAACGMLNDIGEGKTYATKELAINAITSEKLATLSGGYYGLAISTYGVHIVYYSGNVVAQTFDFASNILKTDTPEYRLFKSYYETQSEELLTKSLDALKKEYYNGKITKTSELDKFLKNNKLQFDFEHSLELAED